MQNIVNNNLRKKSENLKKCRIQPSGYQPSIYIKKILCVFIPQEQVHQSGLDDMLSADRQSLLDEVDSLHHQLLEARAQLQDSKDSLDQRISQLEDAKTNAEWKLQRQSTDLYIFFLIRFTA